MKLISAFYGDSTNFLDNVWTNPFDSFMHGFNNAEETEEQSVWTGSQVKLRQDEVRNCIGTTNLKAFDEGTTGGEKSFKKEEVAAPMPDVFDVIFENSNPSNVSIGIVGNEISQTTSAVPSEAELGENKKPEAGASHSAEPGKEPDFKFSNLELNCFENCVSCNFVDSLQSARALFIFTHSWLKKSKLFYTLKDHPMDYVNVILDLSELYRYLAFYEEDIEK